MMGRALLMLGWVSTAGLVATAVLGYQIADQGSLGWHLLGALFSSLLLLFSHSWILFYLIGTGKAIKSAVHEHGLGDELVEKTREFKNRSNPWLMLAMLVVMVTFIIGGGVATRIVPTWVHSSMFFISLAIQVRALWIEGKVLGENERLMRQLDRRIRLSEPNQESVRTPTRDVDQGSSG